MTRSVPPLNLNEFWGALQMLEREHAWLIEEIGKRPGDYLEVGAGDGVFAVYAARSFPEKEIHVVDAWTDGVGTDAGHRHYLEKNITCHGVCNVRYLGETTDTAIVELTPRYGVVFIDGTHDYEHAFHDTVMSWPLLQPGGLLLWHDVTNYPPVARAAIDFARQEHRPLLTAAGTMLAIEKDAP